MKLQVAERVRISQGEWRPLLIYCSTYGRRTRVLEVLVKFRFPPWDPDLLPPRTTTTTTNDGAILLPKI